MTIKTFLAITGTTLMAGTTLLAAPAGATEVTAEPAIQVKLNAANGTGCKADGDQVTVRSYASGVVELNLPQMKTKAGGTNGGAATLNCIANLGVTPPAGYTYTVEALGIKGFANLDEGTSGSAIVTTYLAGQKETGKVSANLTGEYRGRWVELDTPTEAITAPCGESPSLSVNARIAAKSADKNKTASMTLRSPSAKDHDVLLALRTIKCD